MEKLKKFLYWLAVPNGYRHDATDKQRRWGIIAFWISAATSYANTYAMKKLREENKSLLESLELADQTIMVQQGTIDVLQQTLDSTMEPEVKEYLTRIGRDLKNKENK